MFRESCKKIRAAPQKHARRENGTKKYFQIKTAAGVENHEILQMPDFGAT
jgi:hypothetical protein